MSATAPGLTCIKQHPGRTWHPAGVIMVRKPLTVQRTAFLVLALMAVTLLSLRSVCDLWFTHLGGAATTLQATPLAPHAALLHDADPAAQCCDSASGSRPIAPLQAAGVGPQPGQGIASARRASCAELLIQRRSQGVARRHCGARTRQRAPWFRGYARCADQRQSKTLEGSSP